MYMEFTERINPKNARWLLANLSEDFLKTHTLDGEEDRFNLTQIKRILQNYTKDGIRKAIYSKKEKDKFGILRDYTNGMQSMPTVFRGFLCKNMTDVDMISCHPTVIWNLCKKHNIPCFYLDDYIKNRKSILDSGVNKYDVIKCINKKSYSKCTGWLKSFDCEIKQIQKAFYAMPEYEKQRIQAETKPKNKEGAFMSHLATTYEAIILSAVLPTDVEVGILMYDGFMFYGDKPDGFLERLSQKALEVGFEIKFAYKAHDETLVMPDDWEDNTENLYEVLKQKYEKDYALAYIENNVTYSYKVNQKINFYSIGEISQHFTNVIIGKNNFFTLWNKDPAKQTYKDIGVYPHDVECPDGMLNLWTGYDAERLPHSDADVEPILKHFKTLLKTEENYNHNLDWFANMLQYPSSQSIMMIWRGEEGSGKSLPTDFMSLIMGRNLSYECQDVKENLFGRFNGHLSRKVYTVINETSRHDMMPYVEKIKTMITSPTITIEEKGQKKYIENNLNHFMMTLNPENPLPMKEGQRRFSYIECSDDLIGNTEYFNFLYDWISRKANQRAFYQFLMERPVKHKLTLKDIPITDDMKRIYEMNRDPIEDYAIEYTGEKTANENYDAYRSWLTRNGLKFEIPKRAFEMKFNKYMEKYGIECKRKTVEGVRGVYVYNKADEPTLTLLEN